MLAPREEGRDVPDQESEKRFRDRGDIQNNSGSSPELERGKRVWRLNWQTHPLPGKEDVPGPSYTAGRDQRAVWLPDDVIAPFASPSRLSCFSLVMTLAPTAGPCRLRLCALLLKDWLILHALNFRRLLPCVGPHPRPSQASCRQEAHPRGGARHTTLQFYPCVLRSTSQKSSWSPQGQHPLNFLSAPFLAVPWIGFSCNNG